MKFHNQFCSRSGKDFVQGQKEDFDEWENFGVSGWSFEENLEYFKLNLKCKAKFQPTR